MKGLGGKANVQLNKTLVRLFSGNITESEVRSIERQSPADQQALQEASGLLADMQALADDPDILALAGSGGLTLAEKARSHWPVLAMAASLVLAVMVGLGSLVDVRDFAEKPGSNIKRYVTRVGEQKTITLADGSRLTLNTGTEALVDMAADARRVILERGEIYFTVTGDPARPFSVDLGARTITVLGTRFSALKLPEKYRVVVEEGVVSLHKTEETASAMAPALTATSGQGAGPGQAVAFGAPAQRRIPAGWVAELDVETGQLQGYVPEDMGRMLSWRQGLLEFHKEPLYKVVKELNRYTGRKILIEDSDIMDLRVYAAVNLKELRNALSGLEQLLPVKVISYYDRIVIVKDEARFGK